MAPSPHLDRLFVRKDCKYSDGWGCYSIPVPAIVGIAIGSAIFIALLIGAYFIFRVLRKRKQKNRNGEGTTLAYAGTERPGKIAWNADAF